MTKQQEEILVACPFASCAWVGPESEISSHAEVPLLRRFSYCTDAESGALEAASIEDALDMVRPTDAQLEDGAFAWVEPEDGSEDRLGVGVSF